MAYWRLTILNTFSVLPVTGNFARDGVNGITPGGRPWNISFVPLSGLKRIMADSIAPSPSYRLPSGQNQCLSSILWGIFGWHYVSLISGLYAVFRNSMFIPKLSDRVPWRNQYSLVPGSFWEIGNVTIRVGDSICLSIFCRLSCFVGAVWRPCRIVYQRKGHLWGCRLVGISENLQIEWYAWNQMTDNMP